MLIREALPSDARAIEVLYTSFVPNPRIEVRAERLEQIRADPANFLLVVEDAAEVVATAFLTLCLDPMFAFRPYAVVENVVVADSRRGRGIGRRLVAHLEALAAGADCTKLMLLSSSHRTDAHAFFERVGFISDKKRGFVKYLPGRRP